MRCRRLAPKDGGLFYSRAGSKSDVETDHNLSHQFPLAPIVVKPPKTWGMNEGQNMKVKIENSDKSLAAIQKALDEANRGAHAHTFNHASSVVKSAANAEAQMAELGILKGARAGAAAVKVSGVAVFKAYQYSRIATRITMARGSNAWFLIGVETVSIWAKGGTRTTLTLTSEQDAYAVAVLRSGYRVACQKQESAAA